jgi:hypothetical protein
MTQTATDGKLRLLEITYIAALISLGILLISTAFQEVDALRYVLLLLGVASVASPAVGLHKRIAGFVAARRGPSYITLALFTMPAGLIVLPLILVYFLWLGVDSGITSREEELLPFMGAIIVILMNLGVLVYNIVEFRQKST